MSTKKTVVINGKFLSQNITGVQRFAREIIAELDGIVDTDIEMFLVADRNAHEIPQYKNIRVEQIGRLKGNLWEQISLPLYVMRKKAVCVNLCNMAPILKPDVVVIHDVSYKVNRHFFSKKFTVWYNFVFSLIINRIKRIITVSEFSRDEICREYNRNAEDITVAYNGWQHFSRIEYDGNVLEKYGLESHKYCFAMSSMAKNKNFRWIAQAARNNPDIIFAISGAVNARVFGETIDFEIPDNLRFLGYVSDMEAKALMRDCRAFLFPTYYEGFGIPPLEAMSAGAECIVSDRSCMREIYGDSVHYIDPDNAAVDIGKLLGEPVMPKDEVLRMYSWRRSAEILYTVLKSLC